MHMIPTWTVVQQPINAKKDLGTVILIVIVKQALNVEMRIASIFLIGNHIRIYGWTAVTNPKNKPACCLI